jgi:glycosyltransferase involved in cell wall biosynthesis
MPETHATDAEVTFIIVHGAIPEVYGGEKSSISTAAALGRTGFRTRFLITADDAFGGELAAAGLDYDVVPVGDPFDGLRAATWRERLARLASILRVNAAGFRAARNGSGHPAIIHTAGIPAFFCGLLGARLARAKVIYHVRTASRNQRTRWFESVAIFLADRTITVSESLRRQLLDTGAAWARPLLAPRTEAIYNGFDFDEIDAFIAATPRAQARAQAAIPDGAISLLMVGAVFKDKGQLRLIEKVLPAVFAEVPNLHVTFVGGSKDERYFAACRAALERTGLAARVRFTGYLRQEDVYLHYRAADILVLPSEREGLPRNAVEGHAFSLPLVATAVVGTVEVVRPGASGYLVANDCVADMIAPLARLAHDPGLRETMGRAGAAHVRAQFGLDRNVREVARVYRELLSGQIQ